MFKYPKKQSDNASSPSGFGQNNDLSPWGAPPQKPTAPVPPAEPSTFGGNDTFAEYQEEPAQSVAPAPVAGATRNVLNSDVSVVGVLRFTDDLLVDGSVEGEITSDGELTVGANASIQAGEKNKVAVRTKSAVIHGRVMGDIEVTDRVVLASSAVLMGDVTASRISIEDGAVFVGYCRVGAPVNTPAPSAPAKKSTKAAAKSSDANLLG